MLIKRVDALNAPKASGAYSQALAVDLEKVKSLIFVSGQVPLNPKTGRMVEEGIREATNQTLDNVEAILKASNSSWDFVVRVDIFLLHFERDWDSMNEEYSKRFRTGHFPARQTVGVKLDSDTLIEISCIAVIPK